MIHAFMNTTIDTVLQGETTLKLSVFLAVVGTALALGIITSLVYIFTNRKAGYLQGLAYSILLLPSVVSVIALVTNDSLIGAAGAITIGGAFTIIRFRSTQGSPKDLVYIFAALTIGLACGRGYLLAGAILVGVIAIVMIVLSLIKFGVPKRSHKKVKVLIAEDLNYVGVFDDVMNKYMDSWEIVKVKSTNYGTMFNISFKVMMKKDTNEKEFLDELRTLNGNLTIQIENWVYDPVQTV